MSLERSVRRARLDQMEPGRPHPALRAAFAIALLGALPLAAGDGELDPTLDSDGRAFRNLTGGLGDNGQSMVVQSGDRILLGGESAWGYFESSHIALAQWLEDGSPDPAFGSGGSVVHVLGGFVSESVHAIARDAAGRILATGYVEFPFTTNAIAARFLPDGTFDPAFSPPEGWSIIYFGMGNAIAEDPGTGTVWVVGWADAVFIWRWSPAGGDPLVDEISVPGCQLAIGSEVAIQPDHRVLFAGDCAPGVSPPINWQVFVGRLLPDGSLDTTFGNGGFQIVAFDLAPGAGRVADRLLGLELDAEGRIVLAVEAADAEPAAGSDVALARLLPSGAFDATFGAGGRTTFGFDLAPNARDGIDAAGDIVVQGDGRIVIATAVGLSGSDTGARHAALARLLDDGALDPTFGGGDGKLDLDLEPDGGTGEESSALTAVRLDSRGRIVAGGWGEWADPDLAFSIARFQNSYLFADGFESGDTAAWSATAP